MSSSGSGPGGNGAALWHLPQIVGVAFLYAKYAPPRFNYVAGQRVDYQSAVEILVATDGRLPIRAWSPVLFVGNTAISTYQAHSDTLYRFVAYDYNQLQLGDVIALGWPQFPDGKEPSQFVYQPPPLA